VSLRDQSAIGGFDGGLRVDRGSRGAKARFGQLHGLSGVLNFVQLAAIIAVLVRLA